MEGDPEEGSDKEETFQKGWLLVTADFLCLAIKA